MVNSRWEETRWLVVSRQMFLRNAAKGRQNFSKLNKVKDNKATLCMNQHRIYHLPFTIYHLPFTIYHLPFTSHPFDSNGFACSKLSTGSINITAARPSDVNMNTL